MPANFTGGNRNNFVQRKPTLRKRKQAEYFARHRTAPLAQQQLPSTLIPPVSRSSQPTFNFAFARQSAPSPRRSPPLSDHHNHSARIRIVPTQTRMSTISKDTHMDYAEKRRRLLATPDWAGLDIPPPRPKWRPAHASPPRRLCLTSHDLSPPRPVDESVKTSQGQEMNSTEILEFSSSVDSRDWVLPPDSSLSPALSSRSLDAWAFNHSPAIIESNFGFDLGSQSAAHNEPDHHQISPASPVADVKRPSSPRDDSHPTEIFPPPVLTSKTPAPPPAFTFYSKLLSPTSLAISESIFLPQIVDWVGPASFSVDAESSGRLFESRNMLASDVEGGLRAWGTAAKGIMGLGYYGAESIVEAEMIRDGSAGTSHAATGSLSQDLLDRSDGDAKAQDHLHSTLHHLSTLSSPIAPSFDFRLSQSQEIVPPVPTPVPRSPLRSIPDTGPLSTAHDDPVKQIPSADIVPPSILPTIPPSPSIDRISPRSSTPSLSDYRQATRKHPEVEQTKESKISINLFPGFEAEDLAPYSTQPIEQEDTIKDVHDVPGGGEGGETDSGMMPDVQTCSVVDIVSAVGADGLLRGVEEPTKTFALRLFEDEKVEHFFDFD